MLRCWNSRPHSSIRCSALAEVAWQSRALLPLLKPKRTTAIGCCFEMACPRSGSAAANGPKSETSSAEPMWKKHPQNRRHRELPYAAVPCLGSRDTPEESIRTPQPLHFIIERAASSPIGHIEREETANVRLSFRNCRSTSRRLQRKPHPRMTQSKSG
jgi:hypothetical protein